MFRRGIGIEIYIDPQAHQINLENPLTEQAAQFLTAIEQIVGPFELYAVISEQLRDGISRRQPSQQRHLMRRDLRIIGKNKGDGETSHRRPPDMRSAPA